MCDILPAIEDMLYTGMEYDVANIIQNSAAAILLNNDVYYVSKDGKSILTYSLEADAYRILDPYEICYGHNYIVKTKYTTHIEVTCLDYLVLSNIAIYIPEHDSWELLDILDIRDRPHISISIFNRIFVKFDWDNVLRRKRSSYYNVIDSTWSQKRPQYKTKDWITLHSY